jgi:cysteine desulfurase
MSDIIYLDHCATTPLDPRVRDRMIEVLDTEYGNPSSRHAKGYAAKKLIQDARRYLAELIGASDQELAFTSGATEAVNIAIRGLAHGGDEPFHVVTSSAEHKAVLETLQDLESKGFCEVSYVDPAPDGTHSVASVESELRPSTQLVALMWANNETGVVNPVSKIGTLCDAEDVPFFCDATQAVGKVPTNVESAKIDLLALSGHKMYGPKGAGALYVRRAIQQRLSSPMTGGGQERGLRGGTQNVTGIVGLGEAARIAMSELDADSKKTADLRDTLEDELVRRLDASVNGALNGRLPHCSNLSIPGVDGQALVSQLREVCISTGSACMSGTHQPSHVLTAMGVEKPDAMSAIRVSVGRFSTQTEIFEAIDRICEVAERVRLLAAESR